MVIAFASSAVRAGDLHVPGDFATIQAAITAAVNGDHVLVAAGTYAENINFGSKSILVEAVDGPAATTIDGGAAGSVVQFGGGTADTPELRGFTIRNGKASDGGGINVGGTGAIIRGNIIEQNTATFEGGGISSAGANALIVENTIRDNTAPSGGGVALPFSSTTVMDNQIVEQNRGGGIYIRGAGTAKIFGNLIADNEDDSFDGGGLELFAAGTPIIRGNIIRGNHTTGNGGAISMVNQSDALIVQNLIVNNRADDNGGAIFWTPPADTPGPKVVNNTIAFNTNAANSASIHSAGFDGGVELVNNIILADSGLTAYACGGTADPSLQSNNIFSVGGSAYAAGCGNQTGNNGNQSVDPMFTNSASEDFELADGSPLIDAGFNMAPGLIGVDFLGRPRIFDGDGNGTATIDIGAFEAIPEPAAILLLLIAAGSLVLRR